MRRNANYNMYKDAARRRRREGVVTMTEARRDADRFVYMDSRAQARASPSNAAPQIASQGTAHVMELASRARSGSAFRRRALIFTPHEHQPSLTSPIRSLHPRTRVQVRAVKCLYSRHALGQLKGQLSSPTHAARLGFLNMSNNNWQPPFGLPFPMPLPPQVQNAQPNAPGGPPEQQYHPPAPEAFANPWNLPGLNLQAYGQNAQQPQYPNATRESPAQPLFYVLLVYTFANIRQLPGLRQPQRPKCGTRCLCIHSSCRMAPCPPYLAWASHRHRFLTRHIHLSSTWLPLLPSLPRAPTLRSLSHPRSTRLRYRHQQQITASTK
jgi:hypothetical protein